MTPTEVIPLVVLVLLLVSASGADVERMEVTFEGDRSVESVQDVLVVAGGTSTVEPGASVAGDVYVVGGTVRVAGTVEGDTTVLGGTLAVTDSGTVTGTVQRIAGRLALSDGASVGEVVAVDPPQPAASPLRTGLWFVVRAVVLGAFGWWVVRRYPLLLDNVGNAISEHAVVSGVVGGLAGATLLVLFVYMAFTLLLLPLSLAGLVGQLLVVLYGQVAFGHVVGRRLPLDHPGAATAAGVAVVLLVLELAGAVPVLGGLFQLAVAAVGFGAVVNTYFGFAPFEPVALPDADRDGPR